MDVFFTTTRPRGLPRELFGSGGAPSSSVHSFLQGQTADRREWLQGFVLYSLTLRYIPIRLTSVDHCLNNPVGYNLEFLAPFVSDTKLSDT